MDDALSTLRTALRTLRRRPAATLVVVATLGLGIGANAAIFAVVRAVLLEPLPYPEAGGLVSVWGRFLPSSGYDFSQFSLSGPELVDYRSQSKTLSAIGAYSLAAVNVGGEATRPERLRAGTVTPEVFELLGVEPELGRTFSAEEGLPGAPPVAVLSHRQWLQRFGADRGVLGSTVLVEATPTRIVGVMPAGFAFPDFAGAEPDLWLPLPFDPAQPGDRQSHDLLAIGRLAPGATLAAAESEMTTLMARWAEDFPEIHGVGHFLYLTPFHDDVVGNVRGALLLLFAAVGLVLLVGCANVGNLLLAQGEDRRREMALRSALGGSRRRLAGQLLTEAGVLAAAGGGLALAVASYAVSGLLAFLPGGLPHPHRVAVDAGTVGFVGLLALVTVALFALLPALRGTAVQPIDALRPGGRTSSSSPLDVRLRQGLIVAEVALGVAVVLVASLLVQTYRNLARRDPGFRPDGALTAALSLPAGAYPRPAEVRAFYAELLDRLGQRHDVEAVGLISSLPLRDGAPPDDFWIEGRSAPAPPAPMWNADFVMASPGAVAALGVPLLQGRDLASTDDRGAPWVALVNRAAGERFWPGESPVGRRFRYPRTIPPAADDDTPWITVVGVVADVRSRSLDADPRPAIYAPLAQSPREASYPGRSMRLVVRTRGGEPLELVAALRDAVRELDPALPLARIETLGAVVAGSLAVSRFTTGLMSLFAAVALALAGLGVYGVLALSVRRRRSEIGVRVALGASAGDVVRAIVGEGLWLSGLGAVLGLVGAQAASGLFSSLLYGVAPADGRTHLVVVATLLAVALAAAVRPALEAARIDPAATLRAD